MNSQRDKPPNIILIVLDALRLDTSYPLRTTLHDFISYSNAISTAPWTLPSHASMFTGLYPSQHGAHETDHIKCTDIGLIRNTHTTINVRLKAFGYKSYGFSANILVTPTYGFDFDVFDSPYFSFPWPRFLEGLTGSERETFERYLSTRKAIDGISSILLLSVHNPLKLVSLFSILTQRTAAKCGSDWPREKGGAKALDFVKRTAFREPFFMFLNLLEIHEPYFKSDNLLNGLTPRHIDTIKPSDLRRWINGYNSQFLLLQKRLIEILKELDERKVLDRSVVVVTSDHGQMLGEHGWVGHGSFLYDELIKVPLLIRYPPNSNVKFDDPHGVISLANLPAFFQDLAKGVYTDTCLYRSTAFAESWGLYEKVPPKREKIARTVLPTLSKRRVAVYSGSSKLTYNITDEKVEEFVSAAAENGGAVQAYLKSLCVDFMSAERKMSNDVTSDEDDALVLDQLRRLGYV